MKVTRVINSRVTKSSLNLHAIDEPKSILDKIKFHINIFVFRNEVLRTNIHESSGKFCSRI